MPKRIPSSEFNAILTAHGFDSISKRRSHAKYWDSDGHPVIIPILVKIFPSAPSAP